MTYTQDGGCSGLIWLSSETTDGVERLEWLVPALLSPERRALVGLLVNLCKAEMEAVEEDDEET